MGSTLVVGEYFNQTLVCMRVLTESLYNFRDEIVIGSVVIVHVIVPPLSPCGSIDHYN